MTAKRLLSAAGGCCVAAVLAGCDLSSRPAAAFDAARGSAAFKVYCAACHREDGAGVPGGGPPLAGSSWVSESEARLIRIVLHGVRGRLEVGGVTHDREMPGFGAILRDGDVAAVLSFVRARFGAPNAPISESAVARVRARTRGRDHYWTVDELLQID